MKLFLVVVTLLVSLVSAKTYYQEAFGAGWQDRWVDSEHDSGYGKFEASPGKFFDDKEKDTGLQTSQDAKFYSTSSKLSKPFSNKDSDLVIQFSVKHEQGIDCGGGYLKFMPSTIDQTDFNGDSQYNIMFGPDICGATKRTHLILNYKGENYLRKSDLRCESDELTHLYTLILRPDQTYDVQIDQKSIGSGNLVDDFDFLLPKEIDDPEMSKPSDWVDEAKILDPEDKKPDGWDDIPELIEDPDAQKPEDWDDEDDGQWEAPTIQNPEYKGEWEQKMMDNPAYKGPWVHPQIANPDYVLDENIYSFDDFGLVGIDIWQVKSGSIFDNIIITDKLEEAEEFAAETWKVMKSTEKKLYEEDKEAQKAAADEEKAEREKEIQEMEDEDSEPNSEPKKSHVHDDL